MTSEYRRRIKNKMLSDKEFKFTVVKMMKKKDQSSNNDISINDIPINDIPTNYNENCGGYCGCTNNDQGGLFGYGVITGNSIGSLAEDIPEFYFNSNTN